MSRLIYIKRNVQAKGVSGPASIRQRLLQESEYDQEILESHLADQPTTATEHCWSQYFTIKVKKPTLQIKTVAKLERTQSI